MDSWTENIFVSITVSVIVTMDVLLITYYPLVINLSFIED